MMPYLTVIWGGLLMLYSVLGEVDGHTVPENLRVPMFIAGAIFVVVGVIVEAVFDNE